VGKLKHSAVTAKAIAAPPNRRTCIIVLGENHSGSSAFTHVLGQLGADLPNNVLGTQGNVSGHLEPQRLAALHDRLLLDAERQWDDCRPLNLDPPSPFAKPETVTELCKQITEDYGASDLFVLNDPRICRLVPVYRRVFNELGIKPIAVMPLCNPVAVAKSLIAQSAAPAEPVSYSSLMWLRQMLDAEFATRDMPRVFTSYESLLDDWRSLVREIGVGINIEWPLGANHAAAEIQKFLADQHAHLMPNERATDDRALDQRADIPDLVKRAYKALKALEGHPQDTAALAALDEIRQEFDSVMATNDVMRTELLARLKSLRAELKSQATALTSQHSAAQVVAQNREAALVARLAALQTEHDTTVVDLNNRFSTLLSEANALRVAIDQRTHDVTTLTSQFTQLTTSHADVVSNLTEQLFTARTKAIELAEDVTKRSSVIADLHNAVRIASDREVKFNSDAIHLTSQLAQLTTAQAERDQRISSLTEQLFAARTKAVELAEDLSQRSSVIADLHDASRTAGDRETELNEAITSLSLELSASYTAAQQAATVAARQIETIRREAAEELQLVCRNASTREQELTATKAPFIA
jgi:hypothetical protein